MLWISATVAPLTGTVHSSSSNRPLLPFTFYLFTFFKPM